MNALRQSMAWLHTWTGLLLGWVLFFVFLTGTYGYVNTEVDRWMRPEIKPVASMPATAELLQTAESRLESEYADSQSWFVYFPGGQRGAPYQIGWRTWPEGDARFGVFNQETLDPVTGNSLSEETRDTGGGQTLYAMHYALHYIPYDAAILIVGAATMFMLVAILTGIVVHKKIFADFFTFRPRKGQRSWLDGHNVLSVAALPFHLMITWSGLIFFMYTYMPFAIDQNYPEGEARDQFFIEAFGGDNIAPGVASPPAQRAPLVPMLREAESRWGEDAVSMVRVESPGREGAEVMLLSREDSVRRARNTLVFDGETGAVLSEGPGGTAPGQLDQVLLGLHEGRFAGPFMRGLFVLAGLAGTAMVATGLVLWSTKRKAKLAKTGQPHAGIATVDVLNVGVIAGLPIGIAAYFWANRLLPIEMVGRADWEVHVMFLTWGATFLYPIIRPLSRAWTEMWGVAAFAYGFLPVLNAMTTDRHLLNSVAQGDWVVAGFDLAALAAGLCLGWVAWISHRKTEAGVKRRPAASSAATGSASPRAGG